MNILFDKTSDVISSCKTPNQLLHALAYYKLAKKWMSAKENMLLLLYIDHKLKIIKNSNKHVLQRS